MTAPSWIPAACRDRLTIHADREAWLADRKARIAAGGIGSTTAGALLGLSPWRSRWSVWAAVHAPQLLDDTPPDPRLLARGLALEPLADRLYRESTGAETWGVSEHVTVRHPGGVLTSSPDAFARSPDGVGIAEYKIVQPWRKDGYPAGVLEVSTLADLDNASTLGRWPVDRQYVVQCMVHLLCTGLDFVDLFAVFAHDVQLGYTVDGWDSPIAVEGVSRLRIRRDDETLAAVLRTIETAHEETIGRGVEPLDGRPPPPWDDTRDPLKGKRDATAEEVEVLGLIATLTRTADEAKGSLGELRARLRDLIADSGSKGITAESSTGSKISASVAASGRLTVRGIK